MVQIFRRHDTDDPGKLIPGEWMPWWWGATEPYPLTAVICCPECSRPGTLHPKIHRIAHDGTVSPSMVCGHLGCRYHEFIKLASWTEGCEAATVLPRT